MNEELRAKLVSIVDGRLTEPAAIHKVLLDAGDAMSRDSRLIRDAEEKILYGETITKNVFRRGS